MNNYEEMFPPITSLGGEQDVIAPPVIEDKDTTNTYENMFPPIGSEYNAKPNLFTVPTSEEKAEVEAIMPKKKSILKEAGVSISPAMLRNDEEAMGTIRQYMENRYGAGVSILTGETYSYDKKQTDDDVFDAYINKMRGFNTGQSINVANELAFLYNASEEDLALAGRAYDTFDSLGGITSKNYTWGETFDGVGDYLRSAIVDPTNLIGLGIGGAIAKVSAKGAVQTVKTAAIKFAEASVKTATRKAGRKGLTEVAKKDVYARAFQRTFEKEFAKAGVQAQVKKEAFKGAIIGGAIESGLSIGVEEAWQQAQIMTGQQEGREALGYGLSALSGFIPAGVSVALDKLGARSASKLSNNYYDQSLTQYASAAAQNVNAQQVAIDLDFNLRAFVDAPLKKGSFQGKKTAGAKVQRDKPTMGTDLEEDFFIHMMFGNEDTGVKGLIESMADAGLRRIGPRGMDDNVTNYIADVMKELPKQYQDAMVNSFRNTVGSRFTKYENYTIEEMSNLFAKKSSDAGRYFSMLSRASNKLNPVKTAAEIAEEAAPISKGAWNKTMGVLGYVQANLIKAIVTHPGTTALNIKGAVSYASLEVAADLVQAALYGGEAGLKAIVGKSGVDPWNHAKAIMSAQKTKFRNLLNPYATYDDFNSYLSVSANARDKLSAAFVSGFEELTPEQSIKKYGFNPKENMAASGMENTLNFMQKVYGSKVADNFMKSQAFMFHLDKNVRLKYNKGFEELVSSPNVYKVMQSTDFMSIEAKSVEEALRSGFSLSFGKGNKSLNELTSPENVLELVATGIEEFRKVPILGMNVPFGRFFNNTVAFMSDVSGTSLLLKPVVGNRQDYGTLISRAAAGWTYVAMQTAQEVDYLDQGLAWSEGRDKDGAVVNYTYDYPQSYFKYMARSLAHYLRDGEVPEEMRPIIGSEFNQTFGIKQLTRDFNSPEESLTKIYESIIDGDYLNAVSDVIFKPVSNAVSGYSRFLEPLNNALTLWRGEDYEVIDRKQGNKTLNESMRYVDNIYSSAISAINGKDIDLAPPKRSITRQGDFGANPSSSISVRENPPTTYAQRILNSVGVPQWTMEARSKDPTSKARVNEIAAFYAERRAKALWENPGWSKLNMAAKRERAIEVFDLAKKDAFAAMEVSLVKNDPELKKIFKIRANNSDKTVNAALRNMGAAGKELDELTIEQLDILEYWITTSKKAGETLLPIE